jgi:hypothetical protein
MGILIAHPENVEKLAALKAFMKALKIRFEEEKPPYNPEFVKKLNVVKRILKPVNSRR